MKSFFAIFALLLTGLNAHAEPRGWTDADGKVNYSDHVPAGVTNSKAVRSVSGKGQTEAPASYSNKSYAEREAEMKKAKQEKNAAVQKKTEQDAQAETKKNNCTASRENVRVLEESGRIVTYDANGERTYLDDAAREQRLADARKAVSTNCN